MVTIFGVMLLWHSTRVFAQLTPFEEFAELKNYETFQFKTADLAHITFQTYLYRPSVSEKGVVIYVHGGSCIGDQFDPTTGFGGAEDFPPVINAGYVVAALTYRGDAGASTWSYGSNRVYLDQNANLTEKAIQDCGDSTITEIVQTGQFLRRLYPKLPIYLWGFSHGSYLVNMAATKYSGLFNWAGIISESGIWDRRLQEYYPIGSRFVVSSEDLSISYTPDTKETVDSVGIGIQSARETAAKLKREGIKKRVVIRFEDSYYRLKSPIAFIRNLRAPLLSTHGLRDDLVDPENMRRLKVEAEKYRLPVYFVDFPDGFHNQFGENLKKRQVAIISFLNKIAERFVLP